MFHGLFSDDNPYLKELEPRYRELADALRQGHCNDCHVPDNPSRTSRLVLLQTPVHAASEIKRLMKAVRDNELAARSNGVDVTRTGHGTADPFGELMSEDNGNLPPGTRRLQKPFRVSDVLHILTEIFSPSPLQSTRQ